MKLKLKEKALPPAQLRLVMPAATKQMLDRYVAFVGQTSGREADRGRDAGAVYGERPRLPAVAEAGAGERFRVAREPDREKPSGEWAPSRVRNYGARF